MYRKIYSCCKLNCLCIASHISTLNAHIYFVWLDNRTGAGGLQVKMCIYRRIKKKGSLWHSAQKVNKKFHICGHGIYKQTDMAHKKFHEGNKSATKRYTKIGLNMIHVKSLSLSVGFGFRCNSSLRAHALL